MLFKLHIISKKRLKEVAARLPKGVDIAIRFDATQFIEDQYVSLILLDSFCCFNCISLLAFLGSRTATINVILAIPTSVVGSFIVLYALGFTL